jgi:hypothetical protein
LFWFKFNLKFLFSPQLNCFLFINCGTILLLFFSPLHRMFKVVAGAFLTGMLFMGCFNDARQYFDILPLGIIGLCEMLYNKIELYTPTIAPAVPMKIKRQNSFSAMNASQK